jgi:hypothetical protein
MMSEAELLELGRIAARGPVKTTRRVAPGERFPREARVAALIGGGMLAVCISVLVFRAFSNQPGESQSTTVPAITSPRRK